MSPRFPIEEVAPTAAKIVVRCAIACPLCGAPGDQYRLNPRMFWYGARELDLQPSDFHCRQGMEGIHPPLYAIWHCAACHFTAEQPEFVAPLEGVLIRLDAVAKRLGEEHRNEPTFVAVMTTLSAGIDTSRPDFLQAIKLHLLAVRVWDLIGAMVKQDYLTQARYCMLLAWLYRDMGALDNRRAHTTAGLATLVKTLTAAWPDLPSTERAALDKAVVCYEATLEIASFTRDPVNEGTVQQRLGRIWAKVGETGRAHEVLRKTLVTTRQAAVATRQRLVLDPSGGGPPPLSAVERAKLVEQERRLLALADEDERLLETVKDLRQARKGA